jgi:hypothetical protein
MQASQRRLFIDQLFFADSELAGVKFTETGHYKQLLLAKPANALPVFTLSPTSLIH